MTRYDDARIEAAAHAANAAIMQALKPEADQAIDNGSMDDMNDLGLAVALSIAGAALHFSRHFGQADTLIPQMIADLALANPRKVDA